MEIGKFEHFWRKQFLKNKSPTIFLHLKYVFCFYINPLTESKIAVVCSNVPLIPEFSPNSGMLSFGDHDANVVILQLHGVYFVQSEMDFAAVASETVRFMEMYIMETKKT